MTVIHNCGGVMALCQCGCGQEVPLSTRHVPDRGYFKGKPLRYINGHHLRLGVDRYEVDPSTGCWNWTGHLIGSGYGRTTYNGSVVCAHVAMYMREFGPIPAGMDVHHKCENRRCVNPRHLEAVTHRRNVQLGKAAKLTDDQVREIRQLKGKMWQKDIAARYGVSQTTISKIFRGVSWIGI